VAENEYESKENICTDTLRIPELLGESMINMKSSIFTPHESAISQQFKESNMENKENNRGPKGKRQKKLVSFVPPELSRKNINFFDMMEEVSTRNIRM
jgi:hypothetical protein